MKLVLMTKNEIEFIKPWVIYHGNLFGYENLHILDSSTDPRVLQFLQIAKILGVDVNYNVGDLDEMEGVLNAKMAAIKKRSDFMIKMDTDEFIILHDPDGTSPGLATNRESMQKVLHSLPYDGNMYKIGYHSRAKLNVEQHCQQQDKQDITGEIIKTTQTFTQPAPYSTKTFFNSRSYKFCDLGAHYGWVIPGSWAKDGKPFHNAANLAIVEYTRCYQRYIELCKDILLSHHYLDGKEQGVMEEFEKLRPLIDKHTNKCKVPSCHKVNHYVDHLEDQKKAKRRYEELFGLTSSVTDVEHMEIDTVRKAVLAAEAQLEPILSDRP